jgi:hypothetical protein
MTTSTAFVRHTNLIFFSFPLISLVFYRTICYVAEIARRPPMSIYNAVSLLELLGPDTEILEPTPAFVHDRRGTSSSVLFHPYPRDVCSSSFTAFFAARLFLLQWRVAHFSVRFRSLWHTCSHWLRDYAQVTNNLLTFVDYLLVINNLLAFNSLAV